MDGKDKKDEVTLSINSGDQVMLWGRSKDYGTCKGIKKNGEKCDMFVNVNACDVCTFHVKREYIKHCGQRANLGNSRPSAARSLRDKVCNNKLLIVNFTDLIYYPYYFDRYWAKMRYFMVAKVL